MTAIDLDPTDVLAVLDFRRDHSPLWHWMKANHDALVERAAGDRLPWIAMCEVFAQRGLANRTGGVPTPACAKLTWHRVKAYLKKQQDRLAAVREKIAEELERKRAERVERDVKREVALAAARSVAPEPRPTWGAPGTTWGRTATFQAPTPAPSTPPVVAPAKVWVEPSVVDPKAGEGIEGLPDKAGYRSENQWYRDAGAVIRKKPGLERTTAEKLFILKVDMIGTQL